MNNQVTIEGAALVTNASGRCVYFNVLGSDYLLVQDGEQSVGFFPLSEAGTVSTLNAPIATVSGSDIITWGDYEFEIIQNEEFPEQVNTWLIYVNPFPGSL